MKNILKIIGFITSILAILTAVKLVLGKFCKKKCEDCDVDDEDDLEIIELDEENEAETEVENNGEQGE